MGVVITCSTAVQIAFAVVTGVEQALSFTPPGYPKSISQCFLFLGYKVYRLYKPEKTEMDNVVVLTDADLNKKVTTDNQDYELIEKA